MGVDTDGIGYETALPVLVSRYVVNRGCLKGDSDQIDSETASPVLVSGYVVNRGCLEGDESFLQAVTVGKVLALLNESSFRTSNRNQKRFFG